MPRSHSGKCFRKLTWKTSREIWAQPHEQSRRAFGGSTRYAVLDKLREAVIGVLTGRRTLPPGLGYAAGASLGAAAKANVPEAGHMLVLEQPDAFMRSVLNMLA